MFTNSKELFLKSVNFHKTCLFFRKAALIHTVTCQPNPGVSGAVLQTALSIIHSLIIKDPL